MGKTDGAVRSSSQHMLASLAGGSGLANAPSEWEINHPARAAPAGGGGSSDSCVPAAEDGVGSAIWGMETQQCIT